MLYHKATLPALIVSGNKKMTVQFELSFFLFYCAKTGTSPNGPNGYVPKWLSFNFLHKMCKNRHVPKSSFLHGGR